MEDELESELPIDDYHLKNIRSTIAIFNHCFEQLTITLNNTEDKDD